MTVGGECDLFYMILRTSLLYLTRDRTPGSDTPEPENQTILDCQSKLVLL